MQVSTDMPSRWGFPTVMDVIVCYRHGIPPGFLTVMDVIVFYRHAIPMGFPTVMAA
jgi:hypothetical protein